MKKLTQNGFTLIELLVATLVFSVILLLCTYGVLQITRSYYKGLTSSRTQQAARSVIDQISQNIQLGGGTVYPTPAPDPTNNQASCAGSQRYSYRIGQKLLDGTNHAMVSDTFTGCNSSPAVQNLTVNGGLTASSRELLAPNMRLAKLTICTPGPATLACPIPRAAGLYQVTVRVVYGDDDLLCSPTANDCSSTSPTLPAADLLNGDLSCRSLRAGTQFCAVSELTTQVQKRI